MQRFKNNPEVIKVKLKKDKELEIELIKYENLESDGTTKIIFYFIAYEKNKINPDLIKTFDNKKERDNYLKAYLKEKIILKKLKKNNDRIELGSVKKGA